MSRRLRASKASALEETRRARAQRGRASTWTQALAALEAPFDGNYVLIELTH